jgi:AbrB family looped-hinge helix DNA binding protein
MGTPVTITSRGVITLPARLRRALGLRADDQLIAELTPEGLLLRPAVTLPVEIYASIRKGFTPEINAISTIIIAVSMALLLMVSRFYRFGGSR